MGRMGFVAMALLLHTLGFALRIYISGRPPVSNMYETVIWVPWGTVIFVHFREGLSEKLVLISACVVAALCLILSGIAPAVLDPSFQPLEAVLNSTFWPPPTFWSLPLVMAHFSCLVCW